MIEREPWPSRLLTAFALGAIVIGFWIFTQYFHVPAHAGVDQNAYLVGGKMLAHHLTPRYAPPDDYAFVGRMWIVTPDGRYYPKYPLGFPTIVAFVYGVAGTTAAHFVSPVLMSLALVATFLIVRQIAGSFAGILGTLMLATSPVTLALANNPNSHAAALCFVTWGMYALLQWWQRGSFRRAAIAGTLLGCAAAVRYTEALLLLPLLFVLLFNLHWRRGRSWAQAGTLLGCWAAPIALVLLFNRIAISHWTGYDPTNESAFGNAFRWEYFARNWETVLRQLNGTGLFFVLPLGLAGLLFLFARNWRLALVLWAWLLPAVLLYASYYWLAHDDLRFSYLRFFLTGFPPVVIGAAWCLTRLSPASPHSGRTTRWLLAPLASLVIVLSAGAYDVWSALPVLNTDQHRSAIVRDATERLRAAGVPSDATLMAPIPLLNHLQFVSDYRLYATEEFDPAALKAITAALDPKSPNGLQGVRAQALKKRLDDLQPDGLRKLPAQLAKQTLSEGRRFFIVTVGDDRGSLIGTGFEATKIAEWAEPQPLLKIDRPRFPADEPARTWRLLELTESHH